MRIMMIGSYPESPDHIDGGVAAAITYLSQGLIGEPDVDLIGVRIARIGDESREHLQFDWPVVDLSLGRLSLGTFYRRQKRRLAELIRRFQPHIVHGQGADLAGFLAVNCGLPSVVTVHGLLGECAKFQTDPRTKARAVLAGMLTERRTIRRATDLIAISPYVTRYYGKEITGRVHDVPNAVGQRFYRVKRAPERGRFLFAGRVANGKGLIELLHAVARSRAAVEKVVLAGAAPDPAYENLVRKEAESLGLVGCVKFAGLLTESDLLTEFSRAEALLLPSFQETAPMVIQQAMAAGLAVIATNVGGIPYQIEHDKTGLVFKSGNVIELAALFNRVGAEPSLSRRLGEAAKAVAITRYDSRIIARSTLSVYQAVMASSQAQAS